MNWWEFWHRWTRKNWEGDHLLMTCHVSSGMRWRHKWSSQKYGMMCQWHDRKTPLPLYLLYHISDAITWSVFICLDLSNLTCADVIRFGVLRHRVVEVANNTLRSCLKPTNKMIKNLVMMELAHINTSHQDFLGGNLMKKSIEDQVQEVRISHLWHFRCHHDIIRVMMTCAIRNSKFHQFLTCTGRIDVRHYFGYATSYQVGALYKRFFPESSQEVIEDFRAKIPENRVSMADLQGYLLENKKYPLRALEGEIFGSL